MLSMVNALKRTIRVLEHEVAESEEFCI